MVDVGERWTGYTASLLQVALRLSNTAFANRLGINTRTVATWHSFPERVPNSEMQEILSVALSKAPDDAKRRLAESLRLQAPEYVPTPNAESSVQLQVAIAIVVDEHKVLVVKRRGLAGEKDSWQFPAGMVKPGLDPKTIAARETLAETGVHVDAVEVIGARVHPATNVYCEYVLCNYLHGSPENADPAENVAVSWAAVDRLTSFIARERIFQAVLDVLEIA